MKHSQAEARTRHSLSAFCAILAVVSLFTLPSAGCSTHEETAHASEVTNHEHMGETPTRAQLGSEPKNTETTGPKASDQKPTAAANESAGEGADEGANDPDDAPTAKSETPEVQEDPLGLTFSLVHPPAPDAGPTGNHPDILSVRVHEGRVYAVVRPGNQVLVSSDGGRTWTPKPVEPNLLEILPAGRYWYGIGGLDRWGVAKRFIRSEDKGATWEGRVTGEYLEPYPHKLTPGFGFELSMLVDKWVLRSPNTKKWKWDNPGLHVALTAVYAFNKDTWFVGGPGGRIAWRTGSKIGRKTKKKARGERDEQATAVDVATLPSKYGAWHREYLGANATPTAFAHANKHLFAATDKGLFVRDAAKAWKRVSDVPEVALNDIAMDPSGRGLVVGQAGAVFFTADHGATWHDYSETLFDISGFHHRPVTEGQRASRSDRLTMLSLNWRAVVASKTGALLFGDDGVIVRTGF